MNQTKLARKCAVGCHRRMLFGGIFLFDSLRLANRLKTMQWEVRAGLRAFRRIFCLALLGRNTGRSILLGERLRLPVMSFVSGGVDDNASFFHASLISRSAVFSRLRDFEWVRSGRGLSRRCKPVNVCTCTHPWFCRKKGGEWCRLEDGYESLVVETRTLFSVLSAERHHKTVSHSVSWLCFGDECKATLN